MQTFSQPYFLILYVLSPNRHVCRGNIKKISARCVCLTGLTRKVCARSLEPIQLCPHEIMKRFAEAFYNALREDDRDMGALVARAREGAAIAIAEAAANASANEPTGPGEATEPAESDSGESKAPDAGEAGDTKSRADAEPQTDD